MYLILNIEYVQRTLCILLIILKIDSLRAGGSTGMLDGIMDALKEILQNGQLTVLFNVHEHGCD